MTALRWLRGVCLASTLCWSAPAFAGEAEAARLFDRASDAFDRHDYAEAARLFQQAFDAAPSPVTAYGVALAWDKAGDSVRAATA